jgi:hypothetical protein
MLPMEILKQRIKFDPSKNKDLLQMTRYELQNELAKIEKVMSQFTNNRKKISTENKNNVSKLRENPLNAELLLQMINNVNQYNKLGRVIIGYRYRKDEINKMLKSEAIDV